MKTLYVLRHAKSSWEDPHLRDYDRPLNERGLRDAPVMAARLLKKTQDQGVKVTAILSSPALRTQTTAGIFAKALSMQQDQIQLEPQIYLAGTGRLLQLIRRFSNDTSAAMLVGHNPTLTDFVNAMSGSSIDNIPTCGLVTLQLPIENWEQANFGEAQLLSLEFPKDEVALSERSTT